MGNWAWDRQTVEHINGRRIGDYCKTDDCLNLVYFAARRGKTALQRLLIAADINRESVCGDEVVVEKRTITGFGGVVM